jgi:hypothetical protein
MTGSWAKLEADARTAEAIKVSLAVVPAIFLFMVVSLELSGILVLQFNRSPAAWFFQCNSRFFDSQ